MVVLLMVIDLIIMEEVKDRRSLFMRYGHKVVFNSLVSPSLRMPHKIGIMVHELVESVRIRFQIDDELLKVI